jgi:hypothetical protein
VLNNPLVYREKQNEKIVILSHRGDRGMWNCVMTGAGHTCFLHPDDHYFPPFLNHEITSVCSRLRIWSPVRTCQRSPKSFAQLRDNKNPSENIIRNKTNNNNNNHRTRWKRKVVFFLFYFYFTFLSLVNTTKTGFIIKGFLLFLFMVCVCCSLVEWLGRPVSLAQLL